MNKKLSSLKRSLSVFAFVSVILLIVFVTLYLIYPVINSGSQIGTNIVEDATVLSQCFVFLFDPSKAPSLSGNPLAMMLSIMVLAFAGVFLILIILGIVYVSIKHRPVYIVYTLAMLAAAYISGVVTIFAPVLFSVEFAKFNDQSMIGSAILSLALFVVAILAVVAIVVTYILGLVYSGKSLAAAMSQEEEEAKAIAEAAGDPEAVQESEELGEAPAEPLVIESEPEPVEEAPVVEEEEVFEPIEEPEEEEAPAPAEEEPAPVVEEEPKVEPEPKEDKQHVEVNVNNAAPAQAQPVDQASLASLLREVVRDIVRDEIARSSLNQPQQPAPAPNGNQTITGATFGGPLVVQYFNGGINGVTTPAPSVVENKTVEKVVEIRKEEPAPAAPVQEEVKVEEKPVEKKEEPVAEKAPATVVEVAPAPAPAPRPLFVKKEPAPVKPGEPVVEEPKKYERISFAERLLQSEKDIHELYNEIKNEILSYGVKSRISAVGDTFRLHKKMYVRITVAGKSLKLYFALNPLDYANGTIPVQDASDKDMYQEIPLVFKVKSPLSVRRCKELIQDVMEKDGLEQGEVGKVNWIKELKAELANEKKKEKEKE